MKKIKYSNNWINNDLATPHQKILTKKLEFCQLLTCLPHSVELRLSLVLSPWIKREEGTGWLWKLHNEKLYNLYPLLRSRFICGGKEDYTHVGRGVARSNHCPDLELLIPSAENRWLLCRRIGKANSAAVNRARYNEFCTVCNRLDENVLLTCADIQTAK
jgi:hypothetical protein